MTNIDHEAIDLGALRQTWAADLTPQRAAYEAMRARNPALPTWGGRAPWLPNTERHRASENAKRARQKAEKNGEAS